MYLLHRALLYIHILSVILSIGPFFLLLPVLKKLKAADRGEAEQAYLDPFRIAVRLAKHAGHVLVVSGVLLVYAGSWPWSTSWIVITVVILLSSLFFLARAFSPTLRKFSQPDLDKEHAVRRLKRSTWIYLALLLIMLWFMVAKPVLW